MGDVFLSNVLLKPNSSDWAANYSSPFPIPTEILRILGITAIFQIYVLKLNETGRNWVTFEIPFMFISCLVSTTAR